MNKLMGLIALTVLLVGCSSMRVAYADYKTVPEGTRHSVDSVEFYSDSKPDWGYEAIGVLRVEGRTPMDNVEKSFRKEAAKRGADAVIKFKSREINKPIYIETSGSRMDSRTRERHPNPVNFGLIGEWKMQWASEEAMYTIVPEYFVWDYSKRTSTFHKKAKVITGTLVRRTEVK